MSIRIAARRPCASILFPATTPTPHASLPSRPRIPQHRNLTTTPIRSEILGLDRLNYSKPQIPQHLREKHNRPKTYPPPPSPTSTCKSPILTLFTTHQLPTLDPTGARTRLFSRTNPEAARVGDILLVRQKSGDPFAGVCLNIRRQGVDTAILLRNELTRVGVEMWYKVYSPLVEGIEVVQRRVKRARRVRLYYMRKPEHDAGSVQNVVTQYIRQRSVLRSGGGGGGEGGGKSGANRDKRRVKGQGAGAKKK